MFQLAGDETLVAGLQTRERVGGGYFRMRIGVFRLFGDGAKWKGEQDRRDGGSQD